MGPSAGRTMASAVLTNLELSKQAQFFRNLAGQLLRRVKALEKDVKELRRCQRGERASPVAVSENYIPLEESKESSVVPGTPGTPLRDDSGHLYEANSDRSSPYVNKHNDPLYDSSSDASPKQSVASNASP